VDVAFNVVGFDPACREKRGDGVFRSFYGISPVGDNRDIFRQTRRVFIALPYKKT